MATNYSASPVFFYADDCPRCPGTLKPVLEFFAAKDITLRVRKPNPQEMKVEGFAFPALFIPQGVLGVKKPCMLVGEHLMTGLTALTSE